MAWREDAHITRLRVDRIDRINNIVALTAATLAATAAEHASRIIMPNVASGSTITLPAATGSGDAYEVFVLATITSNNLIVEVASASDVFAGAIVGAIDGGTTNNLWLTAATSDTITLNGTTKGGYLGDQLTFTDVSSGVWRVSGLLKQTGTEVTPFSAAV